jgi:iron complex outermembrane recepter protein
MTVARTLAVLVIVSSVTGIAIAEEHPPATPDTLDRIVPLPEIVVSTTRSDERAPIARAKLTRAEIRERNWGQDTPMALAALPGAYAYSDAGNGIGYSYLSIRGFPQRRISVLVNGVPLNDPESHEVYWIDHPDLLASTAEVEMQRGVGSALYGAASVGGSVNLETAPFGEIPSATALVAYGSYETKRLMLEGASGRLAGGWDLYGRYSRVETFGYREHSESKLWSYAFSGRKLTGNHSLRWNLYGGPEETHLAYLGVPGAYLEGAITGDVDRDRRFNPIEYRNERDHFFEPHDELIHTWAPGGGLTFSQTLFWFDGKGYYDEQRAARNLADYRLAPWATTDSTLLPRSYYRDANGDGALDQDGAGRFTVERFDLVRRRTVANRHYGWVPRARLEHGAGALTIGAELRAHDGRHWGEVITGNGLPPGTAPDHVYYDYHPRTMSAGLFAREEWQPRRELTVTADLAWRHQGYSMRGDHFDGIRFDQPYDFALPRLGASWGSGGAWRAFASVAHSRREPAFRDLYDAEGVGSVPLYRRVAAGIFEDPLIKPEKVMDYEAGGEWRSSARRFSINLFHMDFRDELVYAGQFDTDLGYPILGNAARSVHEGIEASGSVLLGGHGATGDAGFGMGSGMVLELSANATLSNNHFVRYREVYGTTPADVVIYDGNAIGFFPNQIANLSARAGWRGLTLGLEGRHVGRIFLDNTETRSASIASNTILDASVGWARPFGDSRAELRVRVFNVLDRDYETGGYMDFDADGGLSPRFIPAATRNALAELRVGF